MNIICKICEKELNVGGLGSHLRIHNLNKQEYYNLYLKKENEGICLNCENETKFISIISGYAKYCKKCSYIKRFKTIRNTWKNKCKEEKDKFVLKNKKAKLIKYGNENYNNIEKMKESCLKKYNVDNPFKSEIIKEKIKRTCLDKYGVDNIGKSEYYWKKRIKQIYNKIHIILTKNNLILVEKIDKFEYAKIKLKCEKGHVFEHDLQYLYLKDRIGKEIKCTICFPSEVGTSKEEKELLEFIKENYEGGILENDRTQISPLELDIYIPKLKLAFEYNGLHWHNELHKPFYYHRFKTDKCEEQGIHLIHIYQDDWTYKQEIVKSRILNLLNKSKRIYARNCQIKEVNHKQSKEFLLTNHVQGNCQAKYRFGLYFRDELVSLMTFGKLRRNLGNINTKDNEFELLRFCNKLNTTVIGGANRLFKHFINNNEVKKIVSYADRSWTMDNRNTLYDKLKFEYKGITKENYWYIVDGIRCNRFKYRKSVLVKEGFDKNKTEHAIMFNREIYRIYDCGQLKYEFYK